MPTQRSKYPWGASPRMPRQRRGIKPPLCKGGPVLAAKQVPLGCIAPHTAQRCHSEPVTDVTAVARPTFLCCHSEPVTEVTGVGIRSPFHADRGLFSFSSERKEEKKRRQKLRFWISLRAFACRLSCLSLPRERHAAQISPKCCIVSAPLSAAAFTLKCRSRKFHCG